MHGSNPLGETSPDDPLQRPATIQWGADNSAGGRPINFMRPPRPGDGECFLAGGLIPPSGKLDPLERKRLYHLMAALETRMWQVPGTSDLPRIAAAIPNPDHGAIWKDGLANRGTEPPAETRWENPSILSGYTYLLQFIAHDMIDTVRSAAITGDRFTPEFHNARVRPLMLDTLYGAGPDESPQSYRVHRLRAELPRSLLRMGELRRQESGGGEPPKPEPRRYCPFQDIARSPDGDQMPRRLTEVLISDPRNDAHALMSQTTVLFSLLHNKIAGLLGELRGDAFPETAYRRFLFARFVVTLIYRNIVAKDVLPRILDPRVRAAYDNGLQLHAIDGVPNEFFAAFRFAHAMVRHVYNVNSRSLNLGLGGALEQSTHQGVGELPVTRDWAVDWEYFFCPRQGANLSRRIGPFYSDGLMQMGPKAMAGPDMGFDIRGLPARDFLTGTYMGLWSVRALFAQMRSKLREQGLADLLPEFDVWKRPLETWLGSGPSTIVEVAQAAAAEGGPAPPPERLTVPPVSSLAKDPPLLFFVLFEAAHDVDERGVPKPAVPQPGGKLFFPGQGGRQLGPFGSIIVAESLYGALRNQPFGLEKEERSMRQRIEEIYTGLLGTQGIDVLEAVTMRNGAERKLDTMPDLLELMSDLEAFA